MPAKHQAITAPAAKSWTAVALAIAALALATAAPAGRGSREAGRAALSDARKAFSECRLADGLKIIEGVLAANPEDHEALYLKVEALLLNGRPEAWELIRRLERAGRAREADVLDLKVDLFLGDEDLPARIVSLTAKYPGDPEIGLVDWLRRLDEGGLDWAADNLPDVERLVMSWVPYRALSIALQKREPSRAAAWAERGLERGAEIFRRTLDTLRRSEGWPRVSHKLTEVELPYVACGPYFGLRMEDVAGQSIRVSLDTGTAGRGFTIHDRRVGDSLSGEVRLVREKAIQYNYMSEAADAMTKTVSFRLPRIENVPVVYFQGALTNTDGVFSPFAFPDLAITIDPVNGRAVLRNREALERYLAGIPEALRLPYRDRNGWIFVRGRLEGRSALLMVESGSRDVNANTLAAKRYGLSTRPGTLLWQGKEHPVIRPDFTFDIGGIDYVPEDGLVSDFALGAYGTGLGSAGDIGPGFLKRFRFTIDPFSQQLIFEIPRREDGLPRQRAHR